MCRSQAKAAVCTIAYHRCIHCVIIIIDHNCSYFGEEPRVCGKRSYLISRTHVHAHHFYSVVPLFRILRSAYYKHPCRTAGKPSEMTELTVLCCHNYCAIAGTPSYYYMHVVTLAWFCFFVVLALARDIRASIS